MEKYENYFVLDDKIFEFVFLNIISQRKLLFVQYKFVIFSVNSS